MIWTRLYSNRYVGRKVVKIGEAKCKKARFFLIGHHRNRCLTQKRMNGFKDNVWKELDKIESIELVLEDFGNMQVISRFKGLKSLTLINCGIAAIEVFFTTSRDSQTSTASKQSGWIKMKFLNCRAWTSAMRWNLSICLTTIFEQFRAWVGLLIWRRCGCAIIR